MTTKYLVDVLNQLRKPPKILINGSAIGYYGSSNDLIFSEDSPSGNDFLGEVCAEWEKLASGHPKNTRLIIIRIGIVLAADGGALGKMLPIFRTGLGGPIGNGKQWMSWIHRTDLCNIVEKILSNKQWRGVINGVSPNPSQMIDFSNTLGKVLKRPTLFQVPAPVLKLVLGDGSKVVLEGQRVTSNKLKKYKFEFKYSDLSKAFKACLNQK